MSRRPDETAPTKGERTRQRLFDAAVARFQQDGYGAASMRSIAKDAQVTPALLYRYFDSKDAIVAELYGRLLNDWAERAASMPKGTWAQRTIWLTRLAFEVLAEYRTLLRALAPAMIEGDPIASPMRNAASQGVARPTFRQAITGAKDAPRAKDVEAYAELAYVGHLALILFWVMDQSEDQKASVEVLEQAERLAPLFKVGLKMPKVGKSLLGLGHTITTGLQGED